MTENNKFPLDVKNGGLAFTAMIFLYVLISFLGQAVCAAIFSVGSTAYIAISSCFSAVALLIVTLFTAFKTDCGGFIKVTKVKKFKPQYVGLSFALSLGMFFGLGFVNDAIVKLFTSFGANIGGITLPLDGIGHLILFSVTFALIPAICEELFFRGVLNSSTDGVKPVFAAIAISLCFALYHCSLAQLLYQLIYGVGLFLLVKASGSVIPAIISHFINNFAVILLEYLKISVNLYNPYFIVGGLIVLIGFFCATIMAVRKTGEYNQKIIDFYLPCGIFGIIVCVVTAICSLFMGA